MPISLSGSLNLSGSLTTTGTITATTLVVQTITSSISSITGSTNFGTLSSNTHTFTGSILTSGSIGIGTASPTKALEIISNTSQDGIKISGTSNPRLTIIDTTNNVQFDALTTDTEAVLRTDTNHPLHLSTNGTLRLTIAASGAATFSSSVQATSISIGAVPSATTTLLLSFTSAVTDAIKMVNTATSGGTWYIGDGSGIGNSAGTLAIANSSGTAVLKIASTGAATFSSGIGIGGATATTGGIQFPATAVAIADGNNLDDYEEGTWTPVLADDPSAGNLATGTFTAQYTKIGRLVTLQASCASITTSGMTSGNILYIRGLPFTIASSQMSAGAANFYNVDIGANNAIAWINAAAGVYLRILKQSPTTNSGLTIGNITTTTGEISFTIQYFV